MQTLSDGHIEQFIRDGFVRIPAFLPSAVMAPVQQALSNEAHFQQVGPLDYLGFTEPADDLLGGIARLDRLVAAAEVLLGERCYHFHSKVVRKPAGRHVDLAWHQDYGSWYKDGCLMPSLLTAVIAITPAHSDNGCLRLLKGSHRLGRMDRLAEGHDGYTYFSLSPQRLAAVLERFEECRMEMLPGDLFLFHCNSLHASGPNRSESPRVLLEVTYNAASNAPLFNGQSYHRFQAIKTVTDETLPGRVPIDAANLVDITDESDLRTGIFKRRCDPGLC